MDWFYEVIFHPNFSSLGIYHRSKIEKSGDSWNVNFSQGLAVTSGKIDYDVVSSPPSHKCHRNLK